MIRKPLIHPHTHPITIPTRRASDKCPVDARTPADTQAYVVHRKPADKSIIPDTISIVSPHAIIVTTEICFKILSRF